MSQDEEPKPVKCKRKVWVMDLGGMVGTFVNSDKIHPNNPFGLNCGDLISVGCPENQSSKEGEKETFVYRLKSPRAFHAQVQPVDAANMLEEDAPTPPPSPGFGPVVDNLPLPDVVRRGGSGVGRGGGQGQGQEEADGVQEQVIQGAAGGAAVVKEEHVEAAAGEVSPAVITLDSSDDGVTAQPGQGAASPDSPPVAKRRRVRHLLSSPLHHFVGDGGIC